MYSSASIPANSYPNYLAAFTRASSSGDAALYTPFFSSMIISWHTARRITVLTRSLSLFPRF